MGHAEVVSADGRWRRVGGLWMRVRPLDDPLLSDPAVRVTVHITETGHAFVRCQGNCAGVDWQTVPPDVNDFAMIDGGPL
jgi:hypothetical protein